MRADAAKLAISEDKSGMLSTFLRPFMIGNDLISKLLPAPSRYVIDFTGMDVLAAQAFVVPYKQVERLTLPDRQKAARKEEERNAKALLANTAANTNGPFN